MKRLLFLLVLAGLALSCFPTATPMETVSYEAVEPGETVFVFLPGRSSRPAEFAEAGFIDELQRRVPEAQVIVADAHFGYYFHRNLVERLNEDIIGPARARGARNVWLVGISMGGLGALFYAREHADQVTGVVALAPFLGDEDVIEEIAAAGGPAGWEPPPNLDPSDYQRDIWKWLKGYTQADKDMPVLYVGYGTEDRFAKAVKMLGEALPEGRTFTTSGGHDWPPWRALWVKFLDSGAVAR